MPHSYAGENKELEETNKKIEEEIKKDEQIPMDLSEFD